MHFFRTSLWQFIFLHVARFSCCIFFILQNFDVTLFLFYVVIFSCCTFFSCCTLYELLYLMLHFYTLQCFRFASTCTLCMLHFFSVALCWFCIRWRVLQQQFFILDVHGVLATPLLFPCCTFSCCTFFKLDSSHFALSPCCTFPMLQFFHVALFLCRTLFMLHFFHDALYSCCTISMLHLCCTIFSFLFVLFSCCTCSSLKTIEYERKTENTTEKQHYT